MAIKRSNNCKIFGKTASVVRMLLFVAVLMCCGKAFAQQPRYTPDSVIHACAGTSLSVEIEDDWFGGYTDISVTVDTVIIVRYPRPSGPDSLVRYTFFFDTMLRDSIVLDSLCKGQGFVYEGVTYTTTGKYVVKWQSDGNSCWNKSILDLTFNDTFYIDIYDTMCTGHPGKYSYMFPPGSVIIEGDYIFNLMTTLGCDSVVNLHVTIPDSFLVLSYDTVCAGSSYEYYGRVYTNLGAGDTILAHSFSTIYGCDSTLALVLHVLDTLSDTIYDTICAGASFDTNGHKGYLPVNGRNYPPYYNQGVYTQYLRDTATGCFHNLVIFLTVNDTLRDTIYPVICAGETFDTNRHHGYMPVSGSNYPPYSNRGVYTQYLRDTATGCYHNLVIFLMVNDTFRDTIRPEICAGGTYTIGDSSYVLSGVYPQHYYTINNCDSTVVVILTVNDTLRDTIRQVICAGAKLDTNGHLGYSPVSGCNYPPYYTQGVYTQYLRNLLTGCFLDLVIDLRVNDTLRDTIRQTICPGSVFVVNDSSYTQPGVYWQYNRDADSCFHDYVVKITMNDTIRDTVYRTLSSGEYFDTNNVRYQYTGVYVQHLRDAATNCARNLVIIITVSDTLRRTICAGANLDTNGVKHYNTGVYTQYLLDSLTMHYYYLIIDLHVNDTLRDTIHPVICAGARFDTNGHLGYSPVSGRNYPPYYMQGVYTQHLRAPDSCYHNLVIDLTVNDTIRDTIHPVICAGARFDTNGHLGYTPVSGHNYPPYYVQGVYTQHLRAPDSCFHNLVIDLTVNDTLRDTIHPVICAGARFDTNGHLGYSPVSGHNYPPYYVQGVYTQHLRAPDSCFHNLVIDLTVNDTIRDTIHPVICAGERFDTNGHLGYTPVSGRNYPPYYVQGVYTQQLRAPDSCFHNLVIDLTVNDTLRDTIHPVICAGARFDTNGHLGYSPVSGRNYPPYYVQGVYTQHLRAPDSCFHNLVIDLTVNDTLRDTIHPVICAGARYDTNGHLGYSPVSGVNYGPYYNQGVYTQHLRAPDSCFHNLVIDLTVNDTIRDTIHPVICAGARFDTNGHLGYTPVSGRNYPPYYVQGVYTQHLRAPEGCFHNLVIDLTVNDTLRDTIHPVICAGARFDTNGHQGCSPVRGVNYGPYYYQGVYTQHLRAPDSCFHNLVIDLTVNDTIRDTIQPVICAGARYDTNGHLGCSPVSGVNYGPYYNQGVYTQHLRAPDSCFHNLVIDLTVNDTIRDTIHPVICAGARFDTNGHMGCSPVSGVNYGPYYYQGIYTQYLRAPDSCFHNLVIDLTVSDTIRDTIHPVICAGARFDTNGHLGCSPVNGVNYGPYYHQGVYTQHLRAPDSCFHNLVIDLTVNDTIRDTIHPVICAGARFDTNGHLGCSPVNGVNYDPYYHQGVYTQHLRAYDSCFHNLVIDLTVNDTLRDTIHPVICAGARFDTNGHQGCSPVSGVNYGPYYNQGVYTQYLRAPDSCFHNLVIDITVNDTIRDTIHPVICAGARFDTNGHLGCSPVSGVNYGPYYNQGVYTQHLRAPDSCFHNLVIDLTVNDTIRDTIHPVICAGARFDTNGHQGCSPVSGVNYGPYYNQGVYTQHLRDTTTGCFRNLVIDLTVNDTIRDTIHPVICAGARFDTNGHLGCSPVSGVNYGPYYHQGVYTQHLRAPDSCFHNLVIDLTVNDTIRDTIHPIICAGARFDTNGHKGCSPVSGVNYGPYYYQGVYTQHLRAPDSCFHNLVIDLTVNDTIRDTIHPVICAGARYDTNGHQGCSPVSGLNYGPYYYQGVYTQYLRASDSCFHNLVIDLTLNDTLRDTIYDTICAGAVLDTNGHLGCSPVSGNNYPPYYLSGVYTQYLRDTTTGCFRNLVINLSVNDTLRDTIYDTICAGAKLDTNGHLGCSPVSGRNYPPYYQSGVYTQYLRDTTTGCFHNLVINLSVNDTLRDTIYDTICAGAKLDTNGHMGYMPVSGRNYPPYYRQGVYTQYLRSADSCYRNLVIILTVNDTLRDTITRYVCAGASFDTNGYRHHLPGMHTQHLRQPDSCYHNLVINLVVYDTLRDTITRYVCAGKSFDTNGYRHYLPGMHTQHLRHPDSCYHNLVINLIVHDTIRDTITRDVCAGRSFDTNGFRYFLPGQYTQHLRQPDSCYNNLVINMIVHDTIRDTITREVCAGRSFDTNGYRYFLQGRYTQHLRQPDSCFNNLVINLTVRDTIRDTIHREVCAGRSFDTLGHRYFYSGIYTHHLRHPDSCFYNLVIDFQVRDTIRDTLYREICAGASFDTLGHSYVFTGYYTHHLRHPDSCFYNIVIDLFVRDTIRDTVHREVCSGHTWDTNGVTYYNTGVYTQYFRDSVTMCFRNLVIDLIVADPNRVHIYESICKGDRYLFNGVYYYTQGIYRFSTWDANGCDSVTVLHLRVLDTAMTHVYDTTYRRYYWFMDSVYDHNGDYYHKVDRGVNGCDSSIVLHLFFCDSTITELFDTICNDSAYRFNGRLLTSSGRYVHNTRGHSGCDSIVVLNLTVVNYPRLSIADSGHYCYGGTAMLKAVTNGNAVSWSSDPPDPSLVGQEHNPTIYVSPMEYTVYTVVVDSVPRYKACPASASKVMNKPTVVEARMLVQPEELNIDNRQVKMTDISVGNVVSRYWLLHEDDPMTSPREVLDEVVVWHTVSQESDSLKVRLKVVNTNGCEDSTDRIIPIRRGDIWVPNVFTPGSDINTHFRVGGNNVIEYEISIYNRGGLLVYRSTDINESWDGTHKGQDCVEGSYVYVINYRTKSNPSKPLKTVGSILLLR